MAGSDVYSGTLELLILKALSWGPMHGYAINKWIRQSTDDCVPINEGALYPALHRLEARGLLREEWGLTERNRDAKFYSLTTAGRKQLRAEVTRWKRYAVAVTATVDRAMA